MTNVYYREICNNTLDMYVFFIKKKKYYRKIIQ